MKKLYLIGGAMGVGKTTISQELNKYLPKSVYLDGDWCWNASPFKVTDETKKMVIDNICHLLNNFLLCSEYDNIIFSWVMSDQKVIDTIIDKIKFESYELVSVSLIADEKTLKERLLKDVKEGLREIDVIERSIKKIPMYDNLNTIKINTCGKTIDELIKEIINVKA